MAKKFIWALPYHLEKSNELWLTQSLLDFGIRRPCVFLRVVGRSDGCMDMDGERFGGWNRWAHEQEENQVLLRSFPSKSMDFNFFQVDEHQQGV